MPFAVAHEDRLSVIDVTLHGNEVMVAMRIDAERMVSGAMNHHDDIMEHVEHQRLALRSLSAEDLAKRIEDWAPTLVDAAILSTDTGQVPLTLTEIAPLEEKNVRIPRNTFVRFIGVLPAGSTSIALSNLDLFGSLIFRVNGAESATVFNARVKPGNSSIPIPLKPWQQNPGGKRVLDATASHQAH